MHWLRQLVFPLLAGFPSLPVWPGKAPGSLVQGAGAAGRSGGRWLAKSGCWGVPGLTAFPISPPGLKPCPMVLVFGCRQSRIDHIYKEETLFAKTQGVFRELYTAYSREPDKPKVRGGHSSGPGVQPWVAMASRHGVEMPVPWHSHGGSCPGRLWLRKCVQDRAIPRATPFPGHIPIPAPA